MKPNYKILSIILLLTALFIPTQVFAQASISIDHVDSLYNGKLQPNMPLKFHLRFRNNTGVNILGQSTGFRLYLSNNGELASGTFEPPVFSDLLTEIPNMFDLVFQASGLSVDGVGSDILTISGTQLFNGGWPDGYDKVIVNIATSVFPEHAGDSLCIDSTFFPPAGAWLWAISGGTVIPDWGGPYCYEILPSCCVGIRGNFNNSADNQVDISDLVDMVSYMFLGGATPTCMEEADLDASGFVDVSDLVRYIHYMHIPIVLPEDCPE